MSATSPPARPRAFSQARAGLGRSTASAEPETTHRGADPNNPPPRQAVTTTPLPPHPEPLEPPDILLTLALARTAASAFVSLATAGSPLPTPTLSASPLRCLLISPHTPAPHHNSFFCRARCLSCLRTIRRASMSTTSTAPSALWRIRSRCPRSISRCILWKMAVK